MKEKKATIVLRLSESDARALSGALHQAASALEAKAEDLHRVANEFSDRVDRLDARRWRSRHSRFRGVRGRNLRRLRAGRARRAS